MDDANIFGTEKDLEKELGDLLNFVLALLGDFGLTDFYLELSTRYADNEKFVGESVLWDRATEILSRVAEASGVSLVPDPGGAAFYGTNISALARVAIGRRLQMSHTPLHVHVPERVVL